MSEGARSVSGMSFLVVLVARWPVADMRARHAMLVDQKTEGVIVPLNEFLKSEGRLELANSTLLLLNGTSELCASTLR